MKTKVLNRNERDGMAEDMDNQCEEDGAVDRIVRIPPIRRYELECGRNAMQQIEDGSWVRYDDHVAAVELMQSGVEKLKEQIAELNKNLRDAKLEAKDFQNMLRGFKQ